MAQRSHLTPKQQAFVTEYLRNGRNAAQAYRHAYNVAPNRPAQRIADDAWKLLQQPEIARIISEAETKSAEATAKVVTEYAVTKELISRELAKLAFIEPDALADMSHGGALGVKLADKRQALMDLAKLHGHVVEKRDVRVIKSIQDLTDEELQLLSAEHRRQQAEVRH